MKRIRCPKCDTAILFDETRYESGRILVFECPECHKQFKLKIPERKEQATQEEAPATPATVTVIENAFHFKQVIHLVEGDNTFGRYVKGCKLNAPIKTVDPSVDTTHCIITARQTPQGAWKFLLRDARSITGTYYMDHILGPKEQVALSHGNIITLGATTMIFREHEEE